MHDIPSGAALPEDDPLFGRKLFSVDQANAALPLVRAIAADLARLSKDVCERSERMAMLRSGRQKKPRDLYDQELAQMEEDLERDKSRLFDYVEELANLGVEPKSGPEGLVDFPSNLNGRGVYLCWKLGEPEVQHWHEVDAGFVGRQPIRRSPVATP
jgi:hypothetical protein